MEMIKNHKNQPINKELELIEKDLRVPGLEVGEQGGDERHTLVVLKRSLMTTCDNPIFKNGQVNYVGVSRKREIEREREREREIGEDPIFTELSITAWEQKVRLKFT